MLTFLTTWTLLSFPAGILLGKCIKHAQSYPAAIPRCEPAPVALSHPLPTVTGALSRSFAHAAQVDRT